MESVQQIKDELQPVTENAAPAPEEAFIIPDQAAPPAAPAPAELPPPVDLHAAKAIKQDLEPLSPQEVAYLSGLEARNRQLTTDLGDAVIALEAQKIVLMNHRRSMTEAYGSTLRMHGVLEGHFNTTAGVIIVTARKSERG